MVRRYFALREDDWGYFLAALIEFRSGQGAIGRALLKRAIQEGERLQRDQNSLKARVWSTFNLALYFLVAGNTARAVELYQLASADAERNQLRAALHDLRFIYQWDEMTSATAPIIAQLELRLEC
jgi:hypothetical protein